MTFIPKAPTPSYFNIDPEAAAARLSEPIDTARFAKAAAFATKGRDDLSKRGYAPDGKKRLRKFSTWEVCRYLLDVAPAHLRRVLKAHPELPQGAGEAGRSTQTARQLFLPVKALSDQSGEALDTAKPRKVFHGRAATAQVVRGCTGILIANRHAAEQHQLRRRR